MKTIYGLTNNNKLAQFRQTEQRYIPQFNAKKSKDQIDKKP